MTSSTTRAFMAKKQSTFSAQVATNLLNVLQGYTKGIRFVAVLTMLFALGVGSIFGEEYKLVTSTNDLVAGEKYLIGTGTGGAVNFISTESKANNRNLASGTVNSQKVTKTDQMMAFTLGGSTGSWTFKTNDYLGKAGYLNATSTTNSNYLKVVATLDKYAYFSISIASNVATITCTGKNSRNIVRYNSSNNSNIISCYTSGYNDVYLYKQVASCDKKVTLTKGSETNGTFTLDQTNGSYDNCDENFVVKVSNIKPKSASQYCSGINVTGGNSSVTGPVDGVWTVTYAKENNITSTITPTYADKTPANISFENMGNPTPTTTGYYVGDTYTLPATNDYTCGDKTFVGWSTDIIENSPTKPTAATYFEPGASVTLAADQTFYAVFAEGSGDGEEGWQKVTSTDQVKDGEIYAFISFDDAYYLANAQSTSNPPVKSVSKTNGILNVTNEMKWIASANSGGFEFKSYSNSDYYLWGGSANDAIRINTTSSKANATKVWYTKKLDTYGVVIYHNASTDGAKHLATNGSTDWRNYLDNNTLGNTNRVANLYKFTAGTTYADYTTQCSTEPSPSLSADPTSLAFGNVATDSNKEMTFTLTGSNLTANASLQLSGINPGMFSLSSNSVTQSDTIDQTITVTYTPTAAGEHTATLTISSTGAESKTVTLSGTGVAPAAKYTVTFDAGSGTCDDESLTETSAGAGVTLPTANPSDACQTEGWTFAGWTTESVSETYATPDPLYVADYSYTPTSDITLYAVYTKTEGGGGTTAQSITNYQDGTYYLIDSFTDAGDNTTYHSPKGTGTKIPSEDMTEYVSVNDNVLTLNLTDAPLTEDMKYTISKENNTYKIYNAETEAYVEPSARGTNFKKTDGSRWNIEVKENRFMFWYQEGGNNARSFLYQDSYNNGGTKTYGQQFGNYAKTEAGTTDNQEGKECYGSGYFFLVPATNSTTTYNSNPECCQQPKNPLTITADQTELVKNGVVQLTATGGNGRPITWSTTSGSLTNQSNTGATLTINDVATTQTITVTASQEKNDDDEPICEQEATIDITVKTQWTIIFQTNDNGVINSNSIIVTDGESYTMPDISDEYICTGSTSFAGWRSTDSNAAPEQIAGNAVKATANTTWYAVWITTNDYTTETRDKYELVTTSQQITQNDVVIITYANGGVALGQMTEEDLYGSPVAVDFSADKSYLTFAEGTAVMPLKVLWWDDAEDDDLDGWYFEDNAHTEHYLTYSGEQGGTLYYETDWWMWDINITSQNNATISDTEEGYEKYNLQYNSSNSRFAFYTSTQKKVQLYRKNGTINIQIPSEPTYTTNNTACTRGAVISAEDGKWVTATNGQKVRTAINVTARGFKSAATLSATSNNPNFVVSLPNPSISASTVVNTTLNVEYTPTTAETTETAQITLTAGETTQTITVNGRSLPDEFVIVTLRNDKYYALPANMQSGANQYSGIEVAPNNSLTQIPVAPSTTIYTLRSVAEARYEAAGNCVRLVGNSNKCLWGNAATTNTTIQNWTTLGATNGSNYEWLLTTSDGELYTIANPAHPDYSTGRLLAMSGTQFGLYKNETVFYILPVGCSSMPANVQVSPRRVDATFSWESNANSTTIDVYTNDAMTSGKISKTASSSPVFFDGLKELTQYWYEITPDGNATCAVTGSFTTTGPTIDVVEWKEDQVVIFVDKDENVNPLVIIDGEVEHNTGSTSATDLFFSKYFEAQGTAKLLAIYNGTTNALPLEEITILHRSKDKNTPLSLASFGKTPGWIQPSEEIILYNVDDREEVMDCAEEDPTFPSWNNVEDGNLAFSGKGTIRLFRGNTCIDIIGAMNSIDDMNNMDASPIEGSEKPEFGDDKGFSTSTGDNYATDDEETNYALSTNRCLLVRKPSVTSGTNAITNNIGDFKTLGNDFTGIANEWAGLQIPNGPSENQFQYTCEGFKEVGSFDYNKYYKEYNNIDGDTYLDSYAHDDETHEYTIDIENLAQYSCLNIRFQLKQGDQILTEAPVQVPIIVNGDKTTADAIFNQIVKDNTAMSIERCATCNVVVLNKAKLTKAIDGTTNDVPTIGNLKVYPGGSVIVPDGTNYTINSLALRRQEDEIAMANIQGTLNIKQTKSVYLDVRIDPTNWHYISLPHDCRVGDIFFTDGTPAILNTDYLLGWYDGAYRAEHKTGGWTYITDNDYILKKGLGYIVALPGDGKVKREIRFPMANSVIVEDKSDKTIDGLYAYGGDKTDEELRPNHKGWNMIGNPYLYTYTADIVKEPLQMGTLSKYGDPWDGSWERTGDARYIVEPIDNGWSGYRQTTITNLKPFTSYFIQVGGEKEGDDYTTVTPETNQSIVFNATSIARSPSSIVRRDTPAEEVEDNHPVWYGIELLAPNNEKDNTTLLISNNFTDGYDMMDDLVKMRGDYYQYYNYPVLASRNDEGEMAFNALPDNSAARVGVPLNYYAAVAGTYTITTDGRFDLEEVKSAILYDATTAQECDLLLEDYTFTTAKGNNSDRFTLFVTVERKKAPSIPTGKDNLLTDGQLSLITIDRTLVLSGLTDKADIYVYDMTGKLIIGAHNSGDNGIWRTSVPTSGVYFVRVNGKTEAQTIKAVVK